MSKFNQFKSDIKKTWHCINNTIGHKKSKSSPIIIRNTDGTHIPNELVSDSFNNYYTSILHRTSSQTYHPLIRTLSLI